MPTTTTSLLHQRPPLLLFVFTPVVHVQVAGRLYVAIAAKSYPANSYEKSLIVVIYHLHGCVKDVQ